MLVTVNFFRFTKSFYTVNFNVSFVLNLKVLSLLDLSRDMLSPKRQFIAFQFEPQQ